MDDLVQRLRAADDLVFHALYGEAADEIERLREETILLKLVTEERDQLQEAIQEMDEGDNPDLWGELVRQRNESREEAERLKKALAEARKKGNW